MDKILDKDFPTYKLVEVKGISDLTPGTQIAVKGSFKNLHVSLKIFYPLFNPNEHYYHHGVYLGECKVAHFSGKKKGDAKPRSCDILEFMKGAVDQKLYRVEYDNPDLLIPINATLDYAKRTIAHPSAWPGYSLIANNCESFATWLKTGKKISAQAVKAVIEVVHRPIRPLAVCSGGSMAVGSGALTLGAYAWVASALGIAGLEPLAVGAATVGAAALGVSGLGALAVGASALGASAVKASVISKAKKQ